MMADDDDDCPSGAWAPRRPVVLPTVEKKSLLNSEVDTQKDEADYTEEDAGDRKGLILSIIALVISIPALFGAWCWPALVMGLVSGTVSAYARHLGHYIAFGITSLLMLVTNAYMLWSAVKYRQGLTPWRQWGPYCLTVLAAFLILADPSRHVLQDTGLWPPPGSSQYRSDCSEENMACLSVIGWLFTVVFTYSGFIFLMIGTLWNANFIAKLSKIKRQCGLLCTKSRRKGDSKV